MLWGFWVQGLGFMSKGFPGQPGGVRMKAARELPGPPAPKTLTFDKLNNMRIRSVHPISYETQGFESSIASQQSSP